MMSLPVLVTTQSVPASYTPPDNMQGLLEAIPQYTSIVLNDTGANVTINASAAGADLNGIWVWMLNQYKLPPRLMTGYRSNWWQIYTGLPGEISMFMGAPTGYFDASGRGIEGSGWEGWALCNGNNNTVNLSGRFIVPGYRYDGVSWVTDVNLDGNYNPVDTYGDSGPNRVQILYAHLPAIGISFTNTDFFKWTKTGTGENWSVIDAGGKGPTPADSNKWVYPLDQSNQMGQIPFSNIPPYVAVGYVQFVGYL